MFMVTLIIGGQNSGKSQFAEELVVNSGIDRRYYLATMTVCDKAGEERVIKHRKQREGKGFITLEIPYAIDKALYIMEEPENSIALLECVANLVGNELYDNPERVWQEGRYGNCDQEENKCNRDFGDKAAGEPKTGKVCGDSVISPDGTGYDLFADTIIRDIEVLAGGVGELMIVTSEYDTDEDVHESTRMYIELIDRVNERLLTFADKVYRL